MLIAITKREKEKNFIKRFLNKSRISISKNTLMGGTFYVVECSREKTPWEKILTSVPENASFLLADGIMPVGAIKTFKSTGRLAKALFVKGFSNMVKSLPSSVKITLVDVGGSYTHLAKEFLSHVAFLRVVTAQRELYEDVALHVLRETGASLMISGDIKSSFDSDIVFIPDGAPKVMFFPSSVDVYAPFADNINAENIFCVSGMHLPQSFIDAVPAGINAYSFAHAMFECGSMKNIDGIELDIKRCI